MLVQVQILSKVLSEQDYSLIQHNDFTVDYFVGYEKEAQFIKDHYDKYGKVPDELSFLDKFPDFDLVEVTDSNSYLVDTLREVHLFQQFSEKMPTFTEKLKTNSFEAREYMLSLLNGELNPEQEFNDVGIVSSVNDRVERSKHAKDNFSANFIPTGFEEIDRDIYGLQRGDEFVVIVARINQGKSWVLEKICTNGVSIGYKVGYFSPEMSVEQIGYRFDTLYGNAPNSSLLHGNFSDEYSLAEYEQYAQDLSGLTGELYVTKPKDFNRKLTVSKLRTWVEKRKLDMIAIDGITYLTDERYKRGDSKTTSLTNISEDLMDLSSELHIPILVVVQANRGGIVDKSSLDTPELENIKDSDGIGANASRVFSVRQLKDNNGSTILVIENKKSRTGEVGQSYKYEWDINTGKFTPKDTVDVGEDDDTSTYRKTERTAGNKRSRQESEEDAF